VRVRVTDVTDDVRSERASFSSLLRQARSGCDHELARGGVVRVTPSEEGGRGMLTIYTGVEETETETETESGVIRVRRTPSDIAHALARVTPLQAHAARRLAEELVLVASDAETRAQAVESGACSAIMRIVTQLEGADAGTMAALLNAVAAIAPGNATGLATREWIGAVQSAMSKWPDDEGVVAGCAGVAAVTACAFDLREDIRVAAIPRLLAAAIAGHPGSPCVQAGCLRALRNCMGCADALRRETVVSVAAPVIALRLLQRQPPADVRLQALSVLATTMEVRDEVTEGARNDMVLKGAGRVAVSEVERAGVLATPPDTACVQMALAVLWHLAFSDSRGSKAELICECRAPEVIVATMRRMSGDVVTLRLACGALRNIAHVDPGEIGLLHDIARAGAIPATLEAMELWQNDQKLQFEALATLANVTVNTPANKQAIVDKEGCRIIASAMARSPMNRDVQEAGATAIGNTVFDRRSQRLHAEAGAIDAVVKAFFAHSHTEWVAYATTGALWNLCFNSAENCRRVAELGGVPLLVGFLRRCATVRGAESPVLTSACGALWTLVADGEHLEAAVGCGALGVAKELVGAFPGAIAAMNLVACLTRETRPEVASDAGNGCCTRKSSRLCQRTAGMEQPPCPAARNCYCQSCSRCQWLRRCETCDADGIFLSYCAACCETRHSSHKLGPRFFVPGSCSCSCGGMCGCR